MRPFSPRTVLLAAQGLPAPPPRGPLGSGGRVHADQPAALANGRARGRGCPLSPAGACAERAACAGPGSGAERGGARRAHGHHPAEQQARVSSVGPALALAAGVGGCMQQGQRAAWLLVAGKGVQRPGVGTQEGWGGMHSPGDGQRGGIWGGCGVPERDAGCREGFRGIEVTREGCAGAWGCSVAAMGMGPGKGVWALLGSQGLPQLGDTGDQRAGYCVGGVALVPGGVQGPGQAARHGKQGPLSCGASAGHLGPVSCRLRGSKQVAVVGAEVPRGRALEGARPCGQGEQ